MRFKARITNENLGLLFGVTSTLERIGQTTALYLDQEFVRLAVMTESPDTPKVYAELRADAVFQDYRIESQSDNTIFFEIELDLLSRALSSGKNAPVCNIKLVKRGLKPCLCLETRALEVEIVHDIPIKIMRASEIVYYRPPPVPPPTVALDLPRGRLMKTIVDRMGKIVKQVQVVAEQSGRIIFSVDHSSAMIKTYYAGLQPRFDSLDRVRGIIKYQIMNVF
jgi:HUS1 checkpoint protein